MNHKERQFVFGQGERTKPAVPGIYAGRVSADNVAPGHNRVRASQTLKIGEATTVKRANGGGGARPWTGADESSGPVTAEMILDGAQLKSATRFEENAVKSARAIASLKGRARVMAMEAGLAQLATLEAGTPRGQDIASDIREALHI